MGKNTTNDMTQGNCMRLLVQFFLPILAGNLFQQLYSFADSMVVGKGIGDTALAAVGNTSSVHFLIIGFAIGLTGGLGICISQSFGSGNYEKLRKELAMSVWICLAIGIVITVVSLAFMRQLFTFLHTPEDLMTETLQYFGTILAGTTITIFNNFAMTLLRSVGNSRVPLVAMIISAIANVLMDLLFVFPLHMGVFGAALATVLAQVLSALYCCYYIGREKNLIPKKTDWKPQSVIIKRLTLKGLPVAVMNSVTAVGGMVLQTFVNNMGTSYVAAYAACTKILSLFEQPANTVGLALLTFVGQNYGAGKKERIRTGIREGVILTILINIPLALMLLCIPEFLTSFMLNDASIISYTRDFLAGYRHLSVSSGMAVCVPQRVSGHGTYVCSDAFRSPGSVSSSGHGKAADSISGFSWCCSGRSICLDRRLDHVDDHLLDLSGKNGFFSVGLRRTSYLGAKLSIEI